MDRVIGRIGPDVDVREAPAWTEPCRIIVISDATGRRHGRIEWLASETGEGFDKALLELYTAAVADAVSPSAASAGRGSPA